MAFSTGNTWSYRGTRTMNQYSNEVNGPGPYMANNHMPQSLNYNQAGNMDLAYQQGCMTYNNQGSYNNMSNSYMPPGQYPPNTYGNTYPNHMYGPMNHHGEGMHISGPYSNSCPPPPNMPGPPPLQMNDGMYPNSGNATSSNSGNSAETNMHMGNYPNGQTQPMGYYSSMINSPLPPSPHQIQGTSPAPTPTPPIRPPGQFAYPSASPMHPQNRTSPISPMMVRSPASVHSNHSIPSSSPGPISSPAQGVKSPLSVNSSGMMSPNSTQSLRSPNQTMRSPLQNHPLNSPSHMPQSMTPSPLPPPMISPNHPAHFSPPTPTGCIPANQNSASNTSHSNGPLQSLQKLVMLPEKRVVDPKSVIGDNASENSTAHSIDNRQCATDFERRNSDIPGEVHRSDHDILGLPQSRGQFGEEHANPNVSFDRNRQDVTYRCQDKMNMLEQYSTGHGVNRCLETNVTPRQRGVSADDASNPKNPQAVHGRRKSERMSTGSNSSVKNSVEGDGSDKESLGHRSRRSSGRSASGEAWDSTQKPMALRTDCPVGDPDGHDMTQMSDNRGTPDSESEVVVVDSPLTRTESNPTSFPQPSCSDQSPILTKKKRGRPVGSKNRVKDPDEVKMKGKKGKKLLEEKVTPEKKVKYLGPVVKIQGPKNSPISCAVVNQRPNEIEKVDKKTAPGKKDSKDRNVSHIPVPDRVTLTNAPWVCCFCGRGSSYKQLGDLYGPYFIEGFRPPVIRGDVKKSVSKTMSGQKRPRSVDTEIDNEIYLYEFPKSKKNRTSTDGKSPKGGEKIVKNSANPGQSSDSTGGSTSPAKSSPGEAWVHDECAIWAQEVCMVGNKLQGLEDAVKIASQTTCSGCKCLGATIGCLHKGCGQKFHYLCAVEKDCQMSEENFSILCQKHKDKKIKMIGSFESGNL